MTGDNKENYFPQPVILGVSIPIFLIYMLLLWLVVRRIGIKQITKPISTYIILHITVFAERLFDSVMIVIIKRRELQDKGNGLFDNYAYLILINLYTIADRLTNFVLMDFVL